MKMMPVYRSMYSNPHQRNQVLPPQYWIPGFEAVSPHHKMDPSKSPLMYESWPCNNNYDYSVPFQGCCNYGNFPGFYGFRPNCPHSAPSPVFHHYPNYPTFHEAYPVCYAPPPHHSMEQPWYEYDKDAHLNHHCCGCRNHPCNQRNDRNLKIEEQEPNEEKQESDSVVPIQLRSCPYPIVWIPPENMRNNGYGKRNYQSQVSEGDKAPSANVSESLKSTEEEPKVWNGWFPVDMNGLKPLMLGEREENPQSKQDEDRLRQFPFPIFWLPSEENENQDKRKAKTAPDHSKQAPLSFEFVPEEPSVTNARMNKPQENKEISPNKSSSDNMEKTDKKCAQVKQIPVHTEGKSEETETKGRNVIVKGVEDKSKKELAGKCPKGKSPSSPKTSKLPSVCLRVDPIPKKKNGNGSSRSPSPPKSQLQQTLATASSARGLKEDIAVKSPNMNCSLDEMKPDEKEIKNVQATGGVNNNNKAEDCSAAGEADLGRTGKEAKGEKAASSEEVVGAENGTETLKATNQNESGHGQSKENVNEMSDVEAAKLIQSAYRGFGVRKWEPLKKLKQLAKVREQVDEVRNRIKAIQTSFELNKDDRQRLLIGEMIMNLLLKLDTVQGLHSSVRDARKSLARELVTLQEKLDSLTSKQVEENVELAAAQSAEHPSVNVGVEMEKEIATAIGISSFEDISENKNDIKEPDQENLAGKADEKSYGKDEQITGLSISDQELNDKVGTESTGVTDIDHTAQLVPIEELQNEASKVKVQDAISFQDKSVSPNLAHLANLPSVPEENYYTGEDSEEKLVSLQIKKINPVNVGETEKLIGNGNGEKELDMLINPTLPAEVENLRCTEKDQGIDLLEELPVGEIEEPAISNMEKCELVGCQSVEQLMEETSDDCVTIQNENELIKNPELESEEQAEEIKVNNDYKFESDCKSDEHYGTLPVDSMASSESEAGSVATQEKEVLFEEKKEEINHPIPTKQKMALQAELQEQEFTYNEDKATEKELGGDDKLIEENKILREMIGKLMEAGKDQLSAISNLTGRVKELEAKLSKNKKLRKPRYRKPIYAPPYSKPTKVKGRAVEVAM